LETLEDRRLLAVTWTGGQSGLWLDAGNWSTGSVPTSQDDVAISGSGITVDLGVLGTSTGLIPTHSLTTSGNITFISTITPFGANYLEPLAGMDVTGNLTLNGASIAFEATQSLSGTGTITVSNTSALFSQVSYLNPMLTVEPGVTIDSDGTNGFLVIE